MKKRILIVDDEPGLAFFLAENLLELGPSYEIKTCHSGAEALVLNQTRPFDLVITDMMMPGLSGFRLVQFLNESHPAPQIILMTAYGNEHVAVKAQNMGIAAYVTKPFEIEEMFTKIQMALENERIRELTKS